MTPTISYELGKKLKDAGIEVKSHWRWYSNFNEKKYLIHYGDVGDCNAPMLHELLEVMPDGFWCKTENIYNQHRLCKEDENRYSVSYGNDSEKGFYSKATFINENPAEACGGLLLFLKNNGYL